MNGLGVFADRFLAQSCVALICSLPVITKQALLDCAVGLVDTDRPLSGRRKLLVNVVLGIVYVELTRGRNQAFVFDNRL